MKADLGLINQSFEHFNELCFNSILPKPSFQLRNAKSYLGKFVVKKPRFFGSRQYSIRISTRYDLEQAQIEDILIHEMIHYYLDFTHTRDTSSHGKKFKEMMTEINDRYGRHMTISVKTRNLRSNTKHKHIVAVITMCNSKTGIMVCAKTRVKAIYRQLTTTPMISEVKWYVSENDFFDQYPRSRNAKIFYLSEVGIKDALTDAIPLDVNNL